MSNPLKIVRKWPQKATLSGPKAEAKSIAEERLPAPSVAQAQQIGFLGHTNSGEKRVVVVLAGEGAPTVTGGWVKIAKVPRFQRVAFTVPEGYEPIEMQIPVQFESVRVTKERPNIEQQIIDLEWMAGRSPHPVEGEVKGEPPYVEAYSVNAEGIQVALVPRQYQGEPGRSQQWYITNILFDPNPLRDTAGARLRQKATVTLTEIVSTPSSLKRNREAREAVKNKYETVYATQAENTVRKIAAAYGIPSSWEAILKANPYISSGEKSLPVGSAVKIPLTAYRQVPA